MNCTGRTLLRRKADAAGSFAGAGTVLGAGAGAGAASVALAAPPPHPPSPPQLQSQPQQPRPQQRLLKIASSKLGRQRFLQHALQGSQQLDSQHAGLQQLFFLQHFMAQGSQHLGASHFGSSQQGLQQLLQQNRPRNPANKSQPQQLLQGSQHLVSQQAGLQHFGLQHFGLQHETSQPHFGSQHPQPPPPSMASRSSNENPWAVMPKQTAIALTNMGSFIEPRLL